MLTRHTRDQNRSPHPKGVQGKRGSGCLIGDTPRTFVNEAHILLVGWREDLAAVGGRAGASVPLAVVDDSGDRGTRGSPAREEGLQGRAPPHLEVIPLPKTHLVIAGVSGPCTPLPDPLGLWKGRPMT